MTVGIEALPCTYGRKNCSHASKRWPPFFEMVFWGIEPGTYICMSMHLTHLPTTPRNIWNIAILYFGPIIFSQIECILESKSYFMYTI
jgi:hypothetical protein